MMADGDPTAGADWDGLFADLSGQMEGDERRRLDAEVADRIRGEVARVALVDRLRAARGHQLRVQVTPELWLAGRLGQVGAGWFGLSGVAGDPDSVVMLARVRAFHGLPPRAAGAPLRPGLDSSTPPGVI